MLRRGRIDEGADMATLPQDKARPGRYGIVGSGWRTGFFHRLAEAMPERFTVSGVVTRTAERGQEVEREWRVPTYRSVGELAADKPDFVIVSVPWDVAPRVTRELVALGIPVLSETRRLPDLDGLRYSGRTSARPGSSRWPSRIRSCRHMRRRRL